MEVMTVTRFGGAEKWPRRACLDQLIPAEMALYQTIQMIDQLPGDTTDMVIELQQVREHLANWVEANGHVKPEM